MTNYLPSELFYGKPIPMPSNLDSTPTAIDVLALQIQKNLTNDDSLLREVEKNYCDLYSAESETAPSNILLLIPHQLLDLDWISLHDCHQYLALREPITITLSRKQALPPIQNGPLRILLTIVPGSHSGTVDDRIISSFVERQNAKLPHHTPLSIELTIDMVVTRHSLQQHIERASSNGEPYHIWHHAGPIDVQEGGIGLPLSDGTLRPQSLQYLLQHMGDGNALRLFILHTPSTEPLLPKLAFAEAPMTIGVRSGVASATLIEGLYRRLLSHDVATAIFLARLDSYIEAIDSRDWTALEFLCHRLPSRLVSPEWFSHFRIMFDYEHERPRFLFLRANPDDTSAQLPLDREMKLIKQSLSYQRHVFRLYDAGALERPELLGLLLDARPHLLHFSGHGRRDGSLLWETHEGHKEPVPVEDLAYLLAELKELRCLVLNACYSNEQVEVLRPHVPVIVGMSYKVSNDAATYFAQSFYLALAHGETVAHAFDWARGQIAATGYREEINIPQISNYEAAQHVRFINKEPF